MSHLRIGFDSYSCQACVCLWIQKVNFRKLTFFYSFHCANIFFLKMLITLIRKKHEDSPSYKQWQVYELSAKSRDVTLVLLVQLISLSNLATILWQKYTESNFGQECIKCEHLGVDKQLWMSNDIQMRVMDLHTILIRHHEYPKLK